MRSDLRAVVGRGLGIVHVVAGLAAAVIVVALWLAPERLGVRADADGRVGLPVGWIEFAGFCGLGLLIVDGLFLLYGRGPREPLRHIVSETRDGSVSITREAVENGLRHAGEGLAEVARTRVSIRQPAARRLVVHAQFWAPESSSIPTASQALRQALRTRFEAMVRPPRACASTTNWSSWGSPAGRRGGRPNRRLRIRRRCPSPGRSIRSKKKTSWVAPGSEPLVRPTRSPDARHAAPTARHRWSITPPRTRGAARTALIRQRRRSDFLDPDAHASLALWPTMRHHVAPAFFGRCPASCSPLRSSASPRSLA